MTTGKRSQHDFCWINIMTPELDRAAAFFQKALGWSLGETIPSGQVVLVGGLAAGNLIDLAACPPGIPPSIGIMVKVADAEATVARVRTLGGSSDGVFEVRGNGLMGVCNDPNGAHFAVWQPLSKDGFECDSHAHGAPTWFETLTPDVDRTAVFYSELFGWTVRRDEMGPGRFYTVFKHGDVPIGGAMTPPMKDVPAHWVVYFAVKNTDETVRTVQEAGGELCMGPMDIPQVGRIALFKSPQGVSFHVIQYAPSSRA